MANYDHGTNLLDDDEYDDMDDFIVDNDDGMVSGEEQQECELDELEEGEEEEEEAPVGQVEILSLRERLKADIRIKNHVQQGASAGMARCSSAMQAPVKDRFGTFFGPSRPSLSLRLIEEGCSSIMKETQKLSSRVCAAGLHPCGQQQKLNYVSEEKRKLHTLRQNRDYSCLFSDDADTQEPTKEQPDNMSALPDGEDNQLKHSAGNSKVSTSQSATVSKGSRSSGLKGAKPSIQRHVQRKEGSLGKEPLTDTKRTILSAQNGSSLPAVKRTHGLQACSNGQKQALQGKRPQALLPGQRKLESSQIQGQQSHGQQSLQCPKPKPSFSGQHSGRKVSAQIFERSTQKQLASSSKPKAPRPISSSAVYNDNGKTRRVVKRKSEDVFDREDVDYSSIIRGMFKYGSFLPFLCFVLLLLSFSGSNFTRR
ncbi:hypothetical protein GUJ93_ZPchr0002g24793 [Zizania palustris]|uniref:Uncharacterized protein n=1 Tax=Zizania palustris TaxID=103762 RepID=A0A8J5VTZ3_ZIZPA|nr:hypothetical protein GUJ93_ZPchr0002g24793 [Zizania palustris]